MRSVLQSTPTVGIPSRLLSADLLLTGLVSMSKQEYLDSVPSAMVAVAGGHEDFCRRQMEELESHIGDDVEQMYKALGG